MANSNYEKLFQSVFDRSPSESNIQSNTNRKLYMQTSHVKSKESRELNRSAKRRGRTRSHYNSRVLEGATVNLGGEETLTCFMLGVGIICKDNFPDSNKWPVTKRRTRPDVLCALK